MTCSINCSWPNMRHYSNIRLERDREKPWKSFRIAGFRMWTHDLPDTKDTKITWRPMYIFLIISRSFLLRTTNVSYKSCREYMLNICSIYAQYIFNICSIYFQYMLNICSIYAQYIFNICSIYVQYMLNICSITVFRKSCRLWVLLVLLWMPNCWLEVSIRKVLRPATSTHIFLGFPVSISKCWDGSQDSKLPLHASHVTLPT